MRREVTGRARYEEIAADLAQQIAQGKVPEGSRISGRSSLAGTYQVSPETIRRAVAILHAHGVVQSVAGSGIRIVSRIAAAEYVESLKARNEVEDSVRELRSQLWQRRELDEKIEQALSRLISQASGALGFQHIDEVVIRNSAWVTGRSLGEIGLRSRTGATAAAVSRGDSDYFSPPANLLLAPGDTVTIIGDEAARARARKLLEDAAPPPANDSAQTNY